MGQFAATPLISWASTRPRWRNWADSGKLPYRRTAGNHRRFNIYDLSQYAQAGSDLEPLELQVIMQSALGQTRMQVGSERLESAPWYAAMSDESKQYLREQGRRVLEAMRKFVADGGAGRRLVQRYRPGQRLRRAFDRGGLDLAASPPRGFYFSSAILY